MSEEKPVDDTVDPRSFNTVDDILNYQNALAKEMFDFQHILTQACLQNAQDWRSVAEAMQMQYRRALKMSELCAWISRKSADGVGDILTAQFGLDDDDVYEYGGDEDESDASGD